MKRIFFSLIALAILTLPNVVSAQSVDINKDVCKNVSAKAKKPSFCQDQVGDSKDPTQNPIYGPNGIITKAVNLFSIVVGIAAVIFIMLAGFRFVISGSDPKEVNQQREHVIYALVALVLVAVAQLMIRYVLLQL